MRLSDDELAQLDELRPRGVARATVSAGAWVRPEAAPAPAKPCERQRVRYGHPKTAVKPTGLFGFWKALWFGVPKWMFWWKP